MSSGPNILRVMEIAHAWFQGATWDAWRACLAALFALPMTPAQLEVYQRHTGRTTAPTTAAREAFIIAGRRAGKSLIASLIALYAAVFKTYETVLTPGERGVVQLVASDRAQSQVVFHYLTSFFDGVPELERLIARRTRDSLHLRNRISIEIATPNFRSLRGRTVVCFIGDETAFWRSDDSANPDVEILHAVRPSMATVPGALLLCISSPYARRGVLWDAFTRGWAQDAARAFVWNADSRSMNPALDPEVVAEAFERDPAVAAAEYGRDGVVSFRSDVESYVALEVVEAAAVPGRYEVGPLADARYAAFCDPAGGSGQDSMTLGIAHADARGRQWVGVLDVAREARPPFSPAQVVGEFADLLRRYGIREVTGDRYAGSWPTEAFAAVGITYEPAARTKSELYQDLLPALNSGLVELLEHRRLLAQLAGLERRTARGGRASIDHAPQGHDDVANSAAGALLAALELGAVEPARVW